MKLILIFLFLIGCGGKPSYRVIQQPPPQQPNPGGGGSGGKTSFQDALSIMNRYCVNCHANEPWFGSDRSLRNSGVKAQVESGNMPPNRAMNDRDKQNLLNFF